MKTNSRLIIIISIIYCLFCNSVVKADGTKIVGGDLSLVPAYESAGDKWLDASGNEISDLITYVKNTCGWNAVRVRLFVDPSKDSDPATCQDITYVEKLGKRIKDAGMYFLLDIHYSDTWADCSKQWIPTDWNMDDATSTGALAKKAYDYTKETLEAMVAYGATPDYVQVGNEISYGMLWDNYTDQATSNAAYLPYSSYTTKWARFAVLFRNGAKAVRKVCPNAKIILHSERTASESNSKAVYDNIISGGLDASDFDIIGLSYYPFWHGTLSQLSSTISTLQSAYPSKEIQIVETAWLNGKSSYPSSPTYGSSNFTWAQSPAGQKAFINDLINTLKNYSNVTGLYYWQPEECGNGASSNGTNNVMSSWDGRGFWDLSWKSASHSLISGDALMALASNSNFVPKTYTNISEVEDNSFVNLDFEYGSPAGWSFDQTFSTQDVKAYNSSWMSSICGGNYVMELWNSTATSGSVISQSCTVANGKYRISVSGKSDIGSANYLFANNAQVYISSTAGTFSVETTVTDKTLNIGIGSNGTGDAYVYFDNFTVECESENITTNSNGVSSYVCANALDFTNVSGLTAYVATATSTSTVTLKKATIVPAGAAFVVKGDPSTNYAITSTTQATPSSYTNLFKAGPYTVASGDYIYVLNTSGSFQKVKAGVTIPTGKAYLKTTSALAKTLSLFDINEDETATNINSTKEDHTDSPKARKALKDGQLVIITPNGSFNVAGARIKF